jgi:hypothetical protein
MAHQLWTVRRLGEFELQGRFFASESGPISSADKMAICFRLGISLTPGMLFEGTGTSAYEEAMSASRAGQSGRRRRAGPGIVHPAPLPNRGGTHRPY